MRPSLEVGSLRPTQQSGTGSPATNPWRVGGRAKWLYLSRPVMVLPPAGGGDMAHGRVEGSRKPKETWAVAVPKPSVKSLGSSAFTQASITLVPSMVAVWIHCTGCPKASVVGGITTRPYLLGARNLMVAQPSGPEVTNPVPMVSRTGWPSASSTKLPSGFCW